MGMSGRGNEVQRIGAKLFQVSPGRCPNSGDEIIMNNSKHRHDGGAYRRMKTMTAAHDKPGKDRSKARRKPAKRKKARKS